MLFGFFWDDWIFGVLFPPFGFCLFDFCDFCLDGCVGVGDLLSAANWEKNWNE